MSATQREPLIKIERAWKEDAPTKELVAYVDRDDDPSKKRKVVNSVDIGDGTAGIEHLVAHTMEQFHNHEEEAKLQGSECFRDFPKCLEGATLRMWEQIVHHDPGYVEADRTKYNFTDAEKHLMNKVCGHNDMRDTQLYWMSHKIKKPKEMSPRDFYFRFQEILSVSLKLGGHFHTPNEHEQKTMLFNAFPASYHERFQRSAMTIEDSSMDDIVNYFQTLHEIEVRDGRLYNRDKRERDDNDRPRISSKKQRGRDRRNNRNHDGHGNGHGSSRRGSRWNEQCHIHAYSNHTWGECKFNPDSDNFQPRNGKYYRRYDERHFDGSDESSSSNSSSGRSEESEDNTSERGDDYDDEDRRSDDNNSRSSRRSRYTSDRDEDYDAGYVKSFE